MKNNAELAELSNMEIVELYDKVNKYITFLEEKKEKGTKE